MQLPFMIIYSPKKEVCYNLERIFSDSFSITACNKLSDMDLDNTSRKISTVIFDVNNINRQDKIKLKNIIRIASKGGIPVQIYSNEYGKTEAELLSCGALNFILESNDPDVIRKRVRIVAGNDETSKVMSNVRSSEAFFDILTLAIPGNVAIFEVIDDYFKVIKFNAAFCEFLGYSRTELTAFFENNEIFDLMLPSYRKTIKNEMLRSLSLENRQLGPFSFKRSDGSIRYGSISGCQPIVKEGRVFLTLVFIDITLQTELYNKVKLQSETDPLTGVYNRAAFIAKTTEMLNKLADQKNPVPYVIMVGDIDNFKVINDIFGTQKGDEVIKWVAAQNRKVAESVKKEGFECTLGRIGADNFVLCMPEQFFMPEYYIAQTYKKIEELNMNYKYTVHFGVYKINYKDMRPVGHMCNWALNAEKSIKNDFVRRVAYFDDDMKQRILSESKIVSEIDSAFENGEFDIYLQPVVNAKTKEVESAEALIRWFRGPEGKVQMPDTFIPIFEKTGDITRIDSFVLDEVCRFLHALKKSKRKLIPVSVNISRADVYGINIVKSIIDIVDKYKISHDLIRFEISERSYSENPNIVYDVAGKLKFNGFEVLMDDFGSENSSLNMIRNMPVDKIKIDKSFLIAKYSDEEQKRKGIGVLKAIVMLSKELLIPSVAEGVENIEQYDFINSLGCESIQGFFFSKPLPKNEFIKLLEN